MQTFLLLLALAGDPAQSQETQPDAQAASESPVVQALRNLEVKRVTTPPGATKQAFEYLQTLDESVWPFKRFIWLEAKDEDKLAAVSYALNEAVAQWGANEYLPQVYKDLVIFDIRSLAVNSAGFQRLTGVFEDMANDDPYFHVVDKLALAAIVGVKQKTLVISGPPTPATPPTPGKPVGPGTAATPTQPPVAGGPPTPGAPPTAQAPDSVKSNDVKSIQPGTPGKDGVPGVDGTPITAGTPGQPGVDGQPGKPVATVTVTEPVVIPFDVADKLKGVRLRRVPLGAEGIALAAATHTNLPIMHYGWFIRTVLSPVDGGRYFQLIGVQGIPGQKQKDQTQQEYLTSRGADEELVAKLNSDNRTAIIRSEVTGKPRRVDGFRGAGVGLTRGTGSIFITHDIADGDIEPGSDPIRNLLTLDDKAREIILEKPAGFHEFTTWDNTGKLVLVVDGNKIASDYTVPNPHTKRLFAAISCIRCHGNKKEGWQPLPNDVRDLLAERINPQLDIFDDLSSKEGVTETVIRLARLYSGDFNPALDIARNTYSDAIFRVTRGKSVPDIAELTGGIYARYAYDLVTPQIACHELGYDVADDDPKTKKFPGRDLLRFLLPPLPITEAGISNEDPILALLKGNKPVNRFQWEGVYADALVRSISRTGVQ